MRSSLLSCAFLAVLLLPAPVLRAGPADPVWLQARSPNFLLFTDTSEIKARRLLTDLQGRFAVLNSVVGGIPERQFPVEVFLFQNNVDFLETAPRPPTGSTEFTRAAYLVRGPDRVFVVARDKSPDEIAEAVGHALGHVFAERLSWWKPFWLAEGAAEYFRKVGRSPDTRKVEAREAFSVADLLKIVPSAEYDDDAPPTAFRTQSHRLFRIVAAEHPAELKAFQSLIRTESGNQAVPKIAVQDLEARLSGYTETRIAAPAATPQIEVRQADAGTYAIHRGDLLLAAGKTSEAASWYNGDSADARAARAILYRFSRATGEPVRLLERASRELPENGLLQYHFGSIETRSTDDSLLQRRALERAVQLLPLSGRAYGQLARVYTLTGDADKAFAHLDRAMELEPEFADEFLMLRSEAYLALARFDEAIKTAELAVASPHISRGVNYNSRADDLFRRVDQARREAEARKLAELRAEVAAKVARVDPPPPPPPPPPPRRFGDIRYEVQSRVPTEVLNAALPEYPDVLIQKGLAGSITLQASVGTNGKVTGAAVTSSQFAEMNTRTLNAVRTWTFKPWVSSGKPAAFDVRIVVHFQVE